LATVRFGLLLAGKSFIW